MFSDQVTGGGIREADEGPKDNDDFFSRSFLLLFSGQVPGGATGEDEGDQKTTTTSLVGLCFSYSMVRYLEEQLERMKNKGQLDFFSGPCLFSFTGQVPGKGIRTG